MKIAAVEEFLSLFPRMSDASSNAGPVGFLELGRDRIRDGAAFLTPRSGAHVLNRAFGLIRAVM